MRQLSESPWKLMAIGLALMLVGLFIPLLNIIKVYELPNSGFSFIILFFSYACSVMGGALGLIGMTRLIGPRKRQ